ncbi:guanylate-binding protein 4-like [Peromyscus californicus insignis]|uniref:guanylate-binding protein 4-like n=1 Tax=Peromyscus californicus insignis TaxID=564181 RepID=UPI0022A6E226|nr:guanylate-binding protein 4-like [Peromyscus californicus insignis]
MASEINMPGPVCLIENIDQQLVANQEALDILSGIKQPVVVVAIVGLYRTGKSYLMNKLAGKQNGFSLGSTVQSHTKGIWMWCVPHPEKPGHTLVLLDTEGLGDIEKGDNQNDCWIFALAVLLSSTFIYNSIGTINQQAMDQLQYVTELTDLIKSKSSPERSDIDDSANFVGFFPTFVWTLRDFSLELKVNEDSITPDDYLKSSLALRKGTDKKTKRFNEPRLCIRKFFPKRKCFVFERPAPTKQLSKLETVSEDDLSADFVKQVAEFTSYIFSSSGVKTLSGGILVNGPRLRTLVQTYLDAISCGTVPCLENAVMTLAQIENSTAVQMAADYYNEQMVQQLRLPTDTLQELLDVHTACEKKAIAVFMEHSFKDDEQEFQRRLVATIEERKDAFMQQNESASLSHCRAELEKLAKALKESVSSGDFSVPGGHSLYIEAREKVEQGYEQVPRKGVKAKEVLKSFLQSQAIVENSILQSDKALTDGQRATAAEQTKREVAEKERELLRQKEKEQEQVMKAQERSFQENIAKLQEKMEREREMLLREQEKMLEHKLKVQEELQEEGFRIKSEMLKNEIRQLREEIEITRSISSLFSQILDTVGDAFMKVLPGVGKICGAGLTALHSLIK